MAQPNNGAVPVNARPGLRSRFFLAVHVFFTLYYSDCGGTSRGEIPMEVILALIIGCAVASVVDVLGRAFVGSASAKLQRRPEFSLSSGTTIPAAVSGAVLTIDQGETALGAELLPEPEAIESPKKARKKSGAKSQLKSTPHSRRRKTAVRPSVNIVQ
jgi:hypothetical protein